MGRMNEKNVTIITAAAMFLLAIGLGAATYLFFYKKNLEAQDELKTKNAVQAALKGKEAELNGYSTGNPPKHVAGWKDKLPDMRKDDEERVDILPTREERRVLVFHDELYRLARESNVIIRKSEEGAAAKTGPKGPAAALPTAAKGPYERVSYIYHVEGVFADVAAFLSRVEGMKRFTKIVSVKFSPNPRTFQINDVKTQVMFVLLDMEFAFYFLPS